MNSPASWTPAIENERHIAWWDFQAPENSTLDGSRYSSVTDLSGNGRTATNATTGTTQPNVAESSTLGGRRAARTDPSGGDPVMTVANVGGLPATNFLMSSVTSAAQLQVSAGLAAGNSLSGNVLTTDVGAIVCFHWGSFGLEWVVNGVVVASEYVTPQSSSGAIHVVLSVNSTGGGGGGRVFDLTTTGPQGYLFNRITAGTGRGWDGDIGEIIVRGFNHDVATRQRYEGYLAHRWAMTSVLDASHPYKNSPPSV